MLEVSQLIIYLEEGGAKERYGLGAIGTKPGYRMDCKKQGGRKNLRLHKNQIQGVGTDQMAEAGQARLPSTRYCPDDRIPAILLGNSHQD